MLDQDSLLGWVIRLRFRTTPKSQGDNAVLNSTTAHRAAHLGVDCPRERFAELCKQVSAH